MSIESLMTQPVTLRKLTGETRTDTGASIPIYSESATLMYLEPRTAISREAESERNTGISEWFGVGRADVEFHNWDQVVYNGAVLDITAPVRPIFNPITGSVSHIEMDLRQVQ